MIAFRLMTLLSFFLAFACAVDEESHRNLRGWRRDGDEKSIVGIAVENKDTFSTLTDLVVKAGLTNELDCSSNKWFCSCRDYTVFAPTNQAFTSLETADPDFFNKVATDEEYLGHLQQLLLYHLVGGKVFSQDISPGPVKSIQGEDLQLSTEGGVSVNGATVVDPFDVPAKNGVIHSVDSVLAPSFVTQDIVDIASSNPDFTTLTRLLGDNNLVDALKGEGPFTVFAPTNEAFEKLGQNVDLSTVNIVDVLSYHVVPGTIALSSELATGAVPTLLDSNSIDVTVRGRKWWRPRVELDNVERLLATDILAKNGVIHVINEVLLPTTIRMASLPSIVDVVSNNEDFSELLGALTATGVATELAQVQGPITVFAPTNAAFQSLQSNGLDVADVLRYHVVSGKFFRNDLPKSGIVTAINDNSIDINARHGVVLNGNTQVTQRDIETSDGVIHVIDKVLIPPKNFVDVLTDAGNFRLLLDAVTAVPGLAQTLLDRVEPFTIFAPTNEAFQAVPNFNDTLNDPLLLEKILTYHVVGDFVPFRDLREGSIPTLQGQSISVRIAKWWSWFRRSSYVHSVTINQNTKVEKVDLFATNSVIHQIDSVLIPE